MTTIFLRRTASVVALALFLFGGAVAAAQTTAPDRDRVVRGYVPPDELVTFPSTTPMDQFLQLVNPTFVRVTGKRVVDPRDRTDAIGVALNGVHFIDAFELVLDRYGLDFSETDGYFIITEPVAMAMTTDGGVVDVISAGGAGAAEVLDLPATADTREIRIDAIIFELDQNRSREVGTNWAQLFGEASSSSGGGNSTEFFLNAGSFFEVLDGFLEASSDQVNLKEVLGLFRYFEQEGYGQTIASPYTTVQSGESATIQSGQDFPINIRDFQGNTITQYVSTGVILNVTPTLISDERDGTVELIHLNVDAQKSSGTPNDAGVVVNKNSIKTQLPLLPGEMRALGGLTSTDERFSRKGVPILKDIPILKFLFSYQQKTIIDKELVIVLQARTVDPLRDRNSRALPDDLIRRERADYRDRMDTLNPGAGDRVDLPDAVDPIDARNDRAPRDR